MHEVSRLWSSARTLTERDLILCGVLPGSALGLLIFFFACRTRKSCGFPFHCRRDASTAVERRALLQVTNETT